MAKKHNNVWLAGVDGCRDRWMVAFVRPNGKTVRLRVISNFTDIIFGPERPTIIVADIPIGMPEFSPYRGRVAEEEVRSRVGRRRSSVFRIPSRSAVYAGVNKRKIRNDKRRYKRACAIARQTSADRKAFAKQGFYLFPKIVEVDKLLRRQKRLKKSVYETHPELAFWRLNGERSVPYSKKHPKGIKLRKRLVIGAGISRAIAMEKPPKGAKIDDKLDALACALIARRIHTKKARPFPDPPPRDAYGLPMAIWA